MNKSLRNVLDLCEKTGGWFDIHITQLDQRNSLDDTPLHTVCSWGELEPVRVLVEAGADVNARGDQGARPLFNAVIGENIEVVKYLIKSGADPKIKNDWDRSVLDYAKNTSAPEGIIQVLKKNIKK
jgi:ankyrin repeat protein